MVHTRGAILEETHYYPFGLTMSGISSKALNGVTENKYKYNKGSELQSKEFSDCFGLELYSTNFRNLDPQIGRWLQIDTKPNEMMSLYASMANNPIANNDPLGDTIIPRVAYDYSMSGCPAQKSDLGNTTDTYISITSQSKTNINITVDILISKTAAFVGLSPGTNIEMQNPGLEREVTAHEEGHKDQLMDAAKLPITVSVNIDGNATNFSGSADNVVLNALAAFSSSQTAAGMTLQDKTNFVSNNIVTPVFAAMGANMNNVVSDPNKESDANRRAAITLGAGTIKYCNNSRPITFNGVILQ